MRMVVDLANFDTATLTHTTGQSGHVFQSHYSDQTFDWAIGRGRLLRFSLDEVRTGEASTLRMRPLTVELDRR
jgi:penicillin amidase